MAENLCAYGKIAGCAACSCIIYAKCSKYVKLRVRDLVHELRPFDFKWDKEYKPYHKARVVHLKGVIKKETISLLKSAAMNWALEHNSKIYKLNTDMTLNRVLMNDKEKENISTIVNPCSGYYLDIARKVGISKDDEIRSCIEGFVNYALDAGCQVFILDRYMIDQPSWYPVKL